MLGQLDARNLQAAADAALQETNAIALIEWLEMLWTCGLDSTHTVLDATLVRLQQLSAMR